MSIYGQLFAGLLSGAGQGLGNYFTSMQQFQQAMELMNNSFAGQSSLSKQGFEQQSQLSQQNFSQQLALQKSNNVFTSALSNQQNEEAKSLAAYKASLAGYTTASSSFGRTVNSGLGFRSDGSMAATSNAAFDNLYSNFSRQGNPGTVDASVQVKPKASAGVGTTSDQPGGKEITPTVDKPIQSMTFTNSALAQPTQSDTQTSSA